MTKTFYPLPLFILFLLLILFFINLSQKKKIESYENFTFPELYFINLTERSDRLFKIKNELNKIGYPEEKIIRVDAIKKKDGALGCGLSHIKALEMGLNSMNDFIIILEDDFNFIYPKEKTLSILRKSIHCPNWNVILLSCNGTSKPYLPFLNKVTDCQTTSGYIVKKKYIPVLLKEWKISMKVREKYKPSLNTTLSHNSSIDISWKKLQHDNWYLTEPKLGTQYASFSSIQQKYVNYNV